MGQPPGRIPGLLHRPDLRSDRRGVWPPVRPAGGSGPGRIRRSSLSAREERERSAGAVAFGDPRADPAHLPGITAHVIQFCSVPDPGSGAFWPLHPGSEMEKIQDPVSGMNIPDR